MILNISLMDDNFITMIRGLVLKFIFTAALLFAGSLNCFALEKIGIITDTLLTPVNYYTAYYRTPEFFAQDIRGELFENEEEN